MRLSRAAVLVLLWLFLPTASGLAQAVPQLRVTLTWPPDVVFAAPRDGCDPDDVPDAPVRAYRDDTAGS